MTFNKALKLLLKGKVKSIKKKGVREQTLETIEYWFCCDKDEESRKKSFQEYVFATDWERDEE